MPTNLENSVMATGLEKVTFHFNAKEGAMPKTVQTTIALIFHASKVMLKILQVRLQQYMNRELSDVRAQLEKAEVITNFSRKKPLDQSGNNAQLCRCLVVIQCCKGPYCKGTWYVRSMNQVNCTWSSRRWQESTSTS